MSLSKTLRSYHGSMTGEHHRYRSWEHCYSHFRTNAHGPSSDRHTTALNLAFYLASWGMYRGSSFLLQHSYTIHLSAVDILKEKRFAKLWNHEFGACINDEKFIPLILEVVGALKNVYSPFAPKTGTKQPTDTLLSKVMLGTFGCLPACDRYFIDGFNSQREALKHNRYSSLNEEFLSTLLNFSQQNLKCLRSEQSRIKALTNVYYPIMKLVDMHFWQLGYERDLARLALKI